MVKYVPCRRCYVIPRATKRELQILELMAKELSNKQIADQLFIAPATVKRHTENIYHKLDVPGRHQAVAKAKGLAIIHTG